MENLVNKGVSLHLPHPYSIGQAGIVNVWGKTVKDKYTGINGEN